MSQKSKCIIAILVLSILFGTAYYLILEQDKEVLYQEESIQETEMARYINFKEAVDKGYRVLVNGQEVSEPITTLSGCSVKISDDEKTVYITKTIIIPRTEDILYPLHMPKLSTTHHLT